MKCLRPRLHAAVQVLVVVCQLGPTTSAGHVERLPETWQKHNGPEAGQRLCLTSSRQESQSQRRRLQDLTVVTSSLRHLAPLLSANPCKPAASGAAVVVVVVDVVVGVVVTSGS